MKNVTPRPPRSQLVPGVILLVIGSYLMALNLGYQLTFSPWRYLPVPLIIAGVWGLLIPNRHIGRSGGAWALGAGLYLACGMFHLFGLSWGTAWPIFIIGAGISIMMGRDRPCAGAPTDQATGSSDTARDKVRHGF